MHDCTVPFSRDTASYLAPRWPGTPFDRLESLHKALRAMAGSTHLAPVRRPERILAVGRGLSHWVGEIGAEFPAALTVAAWTDAVRDGQYPEPGTEVRADLARGLPFPDGAFDYVHHRMFPFAVYEQDRALQIDELVRVVAPGGWIEVVETEPTMLPLSPSAERLRRQILQLLEATQDGGQAPQPPAVLLRTRGLVDVDARCFELPVGSWGGAVGTAMLSNFRALMGMVAPALEVRLGIPTLETLGLVARATEEIDKGRTVTPLWFVWGRRPAGVGD